MLAMVGSRFCCPRSAACSPRRWTDAASSDGHRRPGQLFHRRLLKQQHPAGGKQRRHQKLHKAQLHAVQLRPEMPDKQDLHCKQPAAHSKSCHSPPVRVSVSRPARHKRYSPATLTATHTHSLAPGRRPGQQPQHRHDHNIQRGQKARLGCAGGADAHLLRRRRRKQRRAAQRPAHGQLFGRQPERHAHTAAALAARRTPSSPAKTRRPASCARPGRCTPPHSRCPRSGPRTPRPRSARPAPAAACCAAGRGQSSCVPSEKTPLFLPAGRKKDRPPAGEARSLPVAGAARYAPSSPVSIVVSSSLPMPVTVMPPVT